MPFHFFETEISLSLKI